MSLDVFDFNQIEKWFWKMILWLWGIMAVDSGTQ